MKHLMKIAALIVLLLVGSNGYAQTEGARLSAEDSIRVTLSRFTIALAQSDARAYVRCFADTSAVVETLVKDRRGLPQIRRESLVANAYAIFQVPANTLFEQAETASIKVDGAIAHAWMPYKFYYAGKVQYCGSQSFHLIRLMSGWKIFYLLETRFTNRCQ